MHLAMTAHSDPEQQQPQVVLDRFAKAAERHADFLRAHANRYSGGDGSGAGAAILLHLEEEAAKNEQAEVELIRAYLSTVYPCTCTTYVTCMALPDGPTYITPVRFLGLYTSPDGSQQLMRQVIWFRVTK